MANFAIDIISNHTVVRFGALRALVDTGAPFSFGRAGGITVDGQEFELGTDFLGWNIDRISQLAGFDVDALIGGDILSNFRLAVDWQRRALSLSNDQAPIAGASAEMLLWSNVPLIELSLPMRKVRVFFDTGAAYSYLCSDVALEGAATGEVSDFYPGFGSFATSLVPLPVHVAGQGFSANFGRLPALLEMSLPLGGAKGIIGADLLKSYAVTLNYPTRRLYLALHMHE